MTSGAVPSPGLVTVGSEQSGGENSWASLRELHPDRSVLLEGFTQTMKAFSSCSTVRCTLQNVSESSAVDTPLPLPPPTPVPSSYVEALMPTVMVQGDGTFGRQLGLDGVIGGGGPHDVLCDLVRREQRALSLSLPCEQLEGSHLPPKERAPSRNQPCQQLPHRLAASRTERNKCLLLQPPSVWYFVMAAQAKTLFLALLESF